MNWTSYFDNIFLINMPHRADRLKLSVEQLHQYNIPFTWYRGIHNPSGANGIYLTLIELFQECIRLGYKNILVFEDDLNIICPEINEVMPLVIEQLPADYLELRLGANIPQPHFATVYSDNLLLVSRMLSLHAVAYSYECMEAIVSLPKKLPIDMSIAEWIQPLKRSYCTYPLLVSQLPGHSNIESRYVDWTPFIDRRYEAVKEYLKK